MKIIRRPGGFAVRGTKHSDGIGKETTVHLGKTSQEALQNLKQLLWQLECAAETERREKLEETTNAKQKEPRMELTLDEWVKQLDKLVIDAWGFSVHDLPDMNFWDMHHDGMTPQQVFKEYMGSQRKIRALVCG